MCPDSLRVYARAGTAENVGHLLRAEKMNVDSLQATNLPTIMMDQAYAKLSEEWMAEESPLQRDWDEELQRVQGFRTAGSTGGAHPKTPTKARTPPRPGAKGSAHKAAKSSAARSPKRARTAPEAEACVPQTVPLQGRPAQGDLVVIPALVCSTPERTTAIEFGLVNGLLHREGANRYYRRRSTEVTLRTH